MSAIGKSGRDAGYRVSVAIDPKRTFAGPLTEVISSLLDGDLAKEAFNFLPQIYCCRLGSL